MICRVESFSIKIIANEIGKHIAHSSKLYHYMDIILGQVDLIKQIFNTFSIEPDIFISYFYSEKFIMSTDTISYYNIALKYER